MKKKFNLVFVLILLLMLKVVISVKANGIVGSSCDFNDVSQTHAAYKQIDKMVKKGILYGYPDGNFYPEKNITRAEMAAIIYRVTNSGNIIDDNQENIFVDVDDEHWAKVYINAAYNNEIIVGDGNGRFRPEDNIKYEEAVKMIICALGQEEKVEHIRDDWAAGYLSYAEEKKITDGVKIEFDKIVDRENIAIMLYNGINNLKKYGVKWSADDINDLGVRCFDAETLEAVPGMGADDGYSDFDDIYPWSEMKRCNIKILDNGEEKVTFEGEKGFSLDGSNGNVFVRIPKFYVEKYEIDGYEYCVVSRFGEKPHPVFLEDGKELDEIYISAFEGYIEDEKLYSISDVIPTNNRVAQEFLDAAKKNGKNYSLYDMRCVDAVWTLMAVEYGCINSNHILGYGVSNYIQPVKTSGLSVYEENNTNSITVPVWSKSAKACMPIGSNITICAEENQRKILTQAKLIDVFDSKDGLYTTFVFDGQPVNIDKSCFIGSAPLNTNWIEMCGVGALNYHTGRAEFVVNSDNMNPIRYRWIENIFGNVWHFLPDVTFKNGKMYVCDSMKDYRFGEVNKGYEYVETELLEQKDNGNKADIKYANYWVKSMNKNLYDNGMMFGETYDKNLDSTQRYGAYYYMSHDGIKFIANGGGFDHLYRCNILTNRAWISTDNKWYLYGARMMYKNID